MATPAQELAASYFAIGNAITGFYVAQTILFLNAIYKESVLLEMLRQPRGRLDAQIGCWAFALLYILAIGWCGLCEIPLRHAGAADALIRDSTFGTVFARMLLVLAVAVIASITMNRVAASDQTKPRSPATSMIGQS
jgi:hypothetical protein